MSGIDQVSERRGGQDPVAEQLNAVPTPAELTGLEEAPAEEQLQRLRAVHARLRSQLDQTKEA